MGVVGGKSVRQLAIIQHKAGVVQHEAGGDAITPVISCNSATELVLFFVSRHIVSIESTDGNSFHVVLSLPLQPRRAFVNRVAE